MEFLPALILFVSSAAFTPGPNNLLIMSSGLNFGIRKSMPHLMGICFGFPAMVIAIGFGAGTLFERYPVIHEVIKVVGVLYLSYLAWRIATAKPNADQLKRSKPFTFFEAALFQWVNPKAWIMATSAMAMFTTVGADLNLQITVIVLVFFFLTWPAVGVWLLFGAGLQRILNSTVHQRIFNIGMATLLLVSMAGIVRELLLSYVL
jgi:threonine/homoserine/homoserine lactone efflux protein